MYCNGWYQVAFERDLTKELTPAIIGTTQLVIAQTQSGIRAFDAFCPHRGAHLAFGGRIDGEVIVCPFHGYRIGLGTPGEIGFRTSEYETLVIGGLVFVRMSDAFDNGFATLMKKLDVDHYFVPGFTMRVATSAEMVIENAFDNSHFRTVHGIHNEPKFRICPSQHGELAVEGTFEIPSSPWQRSKKEGGMLQVPFIARAFSPGIVVSEMGGDDPYWVATTATPTPDGDCVIRLSLAVPATTDSPPSIELCQYLLKQSKAGIEKDRVIWENMSITSPTRLTARDAAIVEFRKFCQRFHEENSHET